MSKKEENMDPSEKSEADIDDELGNLFEENEEEVEEAPVAPKGKPDPASAFKKIPVTLTLEVDSVQVMLSDIMNLAKGDVLPMNKKVDEPLDVRVNGSLIARAELVVVEGNNYGLRLIDVIENAEDGEGSTG